MNQIDSPPDQSPAKLPHPEITTENIQKPGFPPMVEGEKPGFPPMVEGEKPGFPPMVEGGIPQKKMTFPSMK